MDIPRSSEWVFDTHLSSLMNRCEKEEQGEFFQLCAAGAKSLLWGRSTFTVT